MTQITQAKVLAVTDLGRFFGDLQYTTNQTDASSTPLKAVLKSAEKHLVPFVVLVAVTWVFLSLGMELFAR